jgi:hypothetical protein
MVASDRMDERAPRRDQPSTVMSKPEAGPVGAAIRRSGVPWIFALVIVVLIELAWLGLLIFVARVLIT